jgi:DNA-directed RNA polymerase specialized sigma24 family protein
MDLSPACGFTSKSDVSFPDKSSMVSSVPIHGSNDATGVSDAGSAACDGVFATTRWSVVLAARGDSETSRAALETLCRTYWFPVYAVVRCQGFDPETARDFTQEFFARLLARDGLSGARRDRGRFRSYLAQSVRNFLHDEWDRARALKRGGGQKILSLDAEEVEDRYLEVAHGSTPDQEFDRQWAEQLLAQARAKLQSEYHSSGRADLLEVLDQTGNPKAAPLADQAARLGVPVKHTQVSFAPCASAARRDCAGVDRRHSLDTHGGRG